MALLRSAVSLEKSRSKGFVLALLACLGLAGAAFISYACPEPARLLCERHGIDISHHNGPDDRSEVAK